MNANFKPKSDADLESTIPNLLTACTRGDLKAVRQELTAGVDVHTVHELHASAAATAISHSNLDILRLVVEHGYDVNRVESFLGERSLHLIIGQPRAAEMARVLLEAGADPNASDNTGRVALMGAAASGDLELMNLLLAHGADSAYVPPDGRTPFYLAAKSGHEACARRMRELVGGDVNAFDQRRNAPLHGAAMAGNAKAVRWLLENGADPTLTGREEMTPLELAQRNGHEEVVKILQEAEAKRQAGTAG